VISGKFLVAAALIVASGGCSLLPASGPTASAVQSGGGGALHDYLLVPIDRSVVAALARFQPPSFASRFATPKPPPAQIIGVGDVLTVTLFEAGQGSLFPSQNGARVTLPLQVGHSGNISIPYAGEIHAAGVSPIALERTIVKDLQGKAVEPQAVVEITTPISSTVEVGGDVKKTGRVPISPAGTRLLDAINDSGGPVAPAFDTRVRLVRHGRTGEIMMQDLVDRPADNVYALPGDALYLIAQPRTFMAFGAVNKPGTENFTSIQMSLIEALSATGGLDPTLSQGTVFLFRYEPDPVARAIKPGYNGHFGPLVPVVYSLNMRDPNAFFDARALHMKDKDVMFVSLAPSVEFQQFLAIVNGVSGTVQSGASAAFDLKR
jgi:polysaccharide export outer membrane protein